MSETISRVARVELVQNLTDATIHRDLDRVVSFYYRDAVALSPVFGEAIGKNAIAANWKRFFSILHDIQIHVSDVLVDGERIVIIGHLTATTGGEDWFGSPGIGSHVADRVVVLDCHQWEDKPRRTDL